LEGRTIPELTPTILPRRIPTRGRLFDLRKLKTNEAKTLLKTFGATDEEIALVVEIESKVRELMEKANGPEICGAWGGGCGGISC